ncbi:MAG: hypothetical protein L6R36_006741 [Xanthoria steineri]|nr:MAG: hypothetical protein L6R36_006741 [Xanthoria steineri]
MHTSALFPLTLLTLPLLSAAIPQNPNPNPQPNPTPAPTQPPTTTLTPEQRNAQFDANYASLARSFVADPAYQSLVTGLAAANIPTPLANAQEESYIVALRSGSSATGSGSVPEPPYITNLPPDQQSWLRNFHQQLVPAATTSPPSIPSTTTTTTSAGVLPPLASVNGTQGAPNANANENGTQFMNGTVTGNPTPTAGGVVPVISPSGTASGAGNGTNGTTNGTSGAMRLGEGRGGVLGMVGMGVVGVVGVMVLL